MVHDPTPAPPLPPRDWTALRKLFPVTRELAYLNHAGVAPISTRVVEALADFAREASERGAFRYAETVLAETERVRSRAADWIGAAPHEVAFVKNTTEGLGLVAGGLDWKPGDRVVTCDLEYPSNVHPWWSLRERGVETIMLRGRDGRLPIEAVDEALRDERVRLVALSSVEFGTGARNDLDAIGTLCHERDALFSVDAIQSVGCLPVDVSSGAIDFLAADGHKWMLACEGCGIFYCREALLDRVRPHTIGWRNVTNPTDFDTYRTELPSHAMRFEEGTPNAPGIYGLGAALDLLAELGIEAVSERVLALGDRLVQGFEERGIECTSPRGPGLSSGIVTFRKPGEAPDTTAARLMSQGVFVVARRGAVRASPHFYNDEGDLERLLAAL